MGLCSDDATREPHLALALALALVAGSANATTPGEVPNPRPGSWVADVADVLSAEQEAALDARIDALNSDLGVELAVVTVPAVDGGSPKQFATELFGAWGIGSAERDDGLLVLLAVAERRVEIETGYGLEGSLPDGWLGTMQAERMVPRFRDGDLGGGLVVGVEAVDERLRAGPVAQAPGPVPSPAGLRSSRLTRTWLFLGSVVLMIAMGWIGFFAMIVRWVLGRRAMDDAEDSDRGRRRRTGARSGGSSRTPSPRPPRKRTPKPPTPRSSTAGGSKGGFGGGRSGGGGAGSSW